MKELTTEELEAIMTPAIAVGLASGLAIGAGIWMITSVLDMVFEFVYGLYLRRKYGITEDAEQVSA